MNQAISPLTGVIIDDKRQLARCPLFCKVQLAKDGQIIDARTLDIGAGGLALMTEVNAPVGQIYSIRVRLPGVAGETPILQTQAQVLHTVLTSHGFRVGLKFIAPDTQTRDLIKRLMNS